MSTPSDNKQIITALTIKAIKLDQIKLKKIVKNKFIPFDYLREIVYQTPYMRILDISETALPGFIQLTVSLNQNEEKLKDYKTFLDKFEVIALSLIQAALNKGCNWFSKGEKEEEKVEKGKKGEKKQDEIGIKFVTLIDETTEGPILKIPISKEGNDIFVTGTGEPFDLKNLTKDMYVKMIIEHPHIWKKDYKLGIDVNVHKVAVKESISSEKKTASIYQFDEEEDEIDEPVSAIAMLSTERENDRLKNREAHLKNHENHKPKPQVVEKPVEKQIAKPIVKPIENNHRAHDKDDAKKFADKYKEPKKQNIEHSKDDVKKIMDKYKEPKKQTVEHPKKTLMQDLMYDNDLENKYKENSKNHKHDKHNRYAKHDKHEREDSDYIEDINEQIQIDDSSDQDDDFTNQLKSIVTSDDDYD
jgi:hypothetical protein